MDKKSFSAVMWRKVVGIVILWGTIGLVAQQAFFYVIFGTPN